MFRVLSEPNEDTASDEIPKLPGYLRSVPEFRSTALLLPELVLLESLALHALDD